MQITDLKQWFLNQTLETDLEELKFYLLDSIYNVLDDKSREMDLHTLMQRLANCYDSNNVLVDLSFIIIVFVEISVMILKNIKKQKISEKI